MAFPIEIKDGYLMITRNGNKYISMTDSSGKLIWKRDNGWLSLEEYDEYGNSICEDFDYMEIYGRRYGDSKIFSAECRKLLWERIESEKSEEPKKNDDPYADCKTIKEATEKCIKDLMEQGMSEYKARELTISVGGLALIATLFDFL